MKLIDKFDGPNGNTSEYFNAHFEKEPGGDGGWFYNIGLDALPETFVPKAVLDVGCGPGKGLRICAQKWSRVKLYGVDFSAVALKICGSRVPHADLTNLDVREAKELHAANLVMCVATMEHIKNPSTLIRKMEAATYGFLMVVTPFNWAINTIHINSFQPEWFEKRGFTVQVIPFRDEKKVLVCTKEIRRK